MRINKIEIRNFRCFRYFVCSFSPGVNILIGKNGAGKSTLVHALHKVLSFIFSNDRSLGKDFLSQGNNTLNVRSFQETDYYYDSKQRIFALDASINAKADYHNISMDWQLYRRNQSNAALYQSYYKKAFADFMTEWKERGANLPLLAYYSDSYPHKYVKTVKYALDIVNNGIMPRNFGYYQWDDEAACTSIWETRICNSLNRVQPFYTFMARFASQLYEFEEKFSSEELQSNDEYQKLKTEQKRIVEMVKAPMEEADFVETRLKDFAEKLPLEQGATRGIEYFTPTQADDGYQLTIHFIDGSFCLMQDLPAGYRRLYSIVFDMAYRSYILNGPTEPTGIVIIDEIDLHLHPSLEQAVVACFSKTFPKVQFIMSTHSAAVISNLDTVSSIKDKDGKEKRMNQILAMREGNEDPEVLPSFYGIDYSETLRDFMDTPSRNTDLKVLEDLYLTYVGHHLQEEAKTVYQNIISMVGEDSPIIKSLLEKAGQYEVHR